MVAVTLIAALAIAQLDAAAQKDYAELLAKYVAHGRVDYKTLGEHDLPKLDRYLHAVAAAKVPGDRSAAIAMYVDAYNAIILKAVLANRRPRSVLDVKDFFDAKLYTVAGKAVSLNQLEKEVLNPYAKDPRTHMVLVCGAVGCPILEDKPYAGDPDLSARFDAAARRYLAGPTGAVVEEGAVKVSSIFSWYQQDFGGEAGVLAFLTKFIPPASAAKMGAHPKISFLDYNWTLNQQ